MSFSIYAPRRSRTGRRPTQFVRAALDLLQGAALAALVAFHGWLLAVHVADGRAFEVETASRWLAALVVVVGFRALRRRGLPFFSGRRAVILWLLVVLIHGHTVWNGGAGIALGLPETAAALAQVAAPLTALGLLLLVLVNLPIRAARLVGRRFERPLGLADLVQAGDVLALSPRPPPLR